MKTAASTLCLIFFSQQVAFCGQAILVQDLLPKREFTRPDAFQSYQAGELELADLYAATTAQNKNYCEIVLLSEGTLRPSPDNTELTSASFRGVPGRAQVTVTNSSYNLSIDDPMGFTSAPSGAEDGTTFSTSYSGAGVTNFSRTAGNIPVNLKNGITDIEVNLSATKNHDAFPVGYYTASLTLRCE